MIHTAILSSQCANQFDTRLLNLLPVGVCICTATGVIECYNPKAAELWGRAPKIGDREEKFDGAQGVYHHDGSALVNANCLMAQALLTGAPIHNQSELIERPDGSRITLLVNIDVVRDDRGQVTHAIKVFHPAPQPTPESSPLQRDAPVLHQLVEQLPLGAYSCNTTGVITNFNQTAVALWGRSPMLLDPLHPYCGSFKLFSRNGTPLPPDQSVVALTLKGQQQVDRQEIIIERPDGTRITALSYASLSYDEEGQLLGVIGLLVDISGSKSLEHTLHGLLADVQNEQERLVQVFDESPAFMAILRGPTHIYERTNERHSQLIGSRPVIGKSVREALPELVDQGILQILDDVYSTGKPFFGTDQKIFIQKEAQGVLEEIWLEFIYQPLRATDGQVNGILVHGIDLTKRKRIEDRLGNVTAEAERERRLYHTILSNVPDLLYVFDRNHKFTYANKALLTTWGIPWEAAQGKNCLELGYPTWHATKHDREIEQVVATKQFLRDEVPFLGTQGLRIYEYIFVPVLGETGEVEAIAGTTRDITDRKKLEQELQARVEEAALADKKKDEFIALLAHELRNPLVPIRNGLKIMDLAPTDQSSLAKVRAMMNRQLEHMVRLVDDLLDISRLGQNKLHLKKARISLADAMAGAVEAVRPAIEAAGHKFTIKVPTELICLEADLTRLVQVFSNLLCNSSTYTRPGGQIWFTAERCSDDVVVVTVRDTGIGIPPDALATVFEMFSQVPQHQVQGIGGLGIGLALVKTLVEMHHGSVSVTSAGPDTGCRFTVRLPLAKTDESQPCSAGESPSLVKQRRRVLVVDDNIDAGSSLALLFQIVGHEVRQAYDGLEALIEAESFRPEIIFMDIGMPHLNGYEATRRLRAEPWGKEIAIVAVTGWGQEGDRSQSKAAGCDCHLVKPVNLQDLEQLLAQL